MVVNRMLGRAQLGQHKSDAAQATYEKAAQMALRTRGPDLAAIYAELGPMYVDDDKLDQAVTRARDGGEGGGHDAGAARWRSATWRSPTSSAGWRGCAIPSRRTARSTTSVDAAQAPKGLLTAKELGGDLAAARRSRRSRPTRSSRREDAWDAAVKTGGDGACSFKPPYDKLGAPFFVAYAQLSRLGQPGRSARRAVKLFTQLVGARRRGAERPIGCARCCARPTSSWPTTIYQRSDEKRAGQYLGARVKVPAKGDKRELEHNLAVHRSVRRASRRRRSACSTRSAARPCEALVNLGILRDRQGDVEEGARALQAAPWTCGARAPKLAEWIDVKERLFGGDRAEAPGCMLDCCCRCLASATDARAADKPITIAIYAPNAPFESGGRSLRLHQPAGAADDVGGGRAGGRARRSRARPISRRRSRTSRSTSPSSTASTWPSAACPTRCWRRRPRAARPRRKWALFSSTATQRRRSCRARS